MNKPWTARFFGPCEGGVPNLIVRAARNDAQNMGELIYFLNTPVV